MKISPQHKFIADGITKSIMDGYVKPNLKVESTAEGKSVLRAKYKKIHTTIIKLLRDL